jgi:NADPH:quinone reductase-like Zn-dependent oxidoreductase
VVVKVDYTGLNPVDWKMGAYNFLIKSYPALLGCDYAGEVVAVGEGVTSPAVGDAVWGFAELGRPGTFAEFIEVEAIWAFPQPSNGSKAQASVLGVAALTAALGVWGAIGLGLKGTIATPVTDSPLLLVWGASTTVGLYVSQFASLAGYTVIGVASKKNFDLIKSFGVTHTVDYHDDDAIEQISKIADGSLRYAFDAASAKTATQCAKLVTGTAEAPATVAYIASAPTETPENVNAKFVILAGAQTTPAVSEYLRPFVGETLLPGLEAGTLSYLPVKELEGFPAISEGLGLLQGNKVSGTKLAVKLA